MIICGIDPGQHGGIAVLDGKFQSVYPMPTLGPKLGPDGAAIADILRHHAPALVVIEKVGAMPKQGVSTTFKFGFNTGLVHGVVLAMRIPVVLVTPQAWKKTQLAGTAKQKSDAVAVAMRLYPDAIRSIRQKWAREACAEALLIARHGGQA